MRIVMGEIRFAQTRTKHEHFKRSLFTEQLKREQTQTW